MSIGQHGAFGSSRWLFVAILMSCIAGGCSSTTDQTEEGHAQDLGDASPATGVVSITSPVLERRERVAKLEEEWNTSEPNEKASAATTSSSALTKYSVYWQTVTGLKGPSDVQEWRKRVEQSCNARLWESGAAEAVAAQFIGQDGGNAEDSETVRRAAWALWIMARDISGCPDRFPALADMPDEWVHATGLLGPLDVEQWRERLERVCGASMGERTESESIASEYIREDGGDPDRADLLNSAIVALRMIVRRPGICPDPAETVTSHP